MTTATTSIPSVTAPTPGTSLDALVDRLVESIFGSTDDEPGQSLTRSVHDARRLRQAGDLDGALALLAEVDMATAQNPPGTLGVRRVARPRTAALPPGAGRSSTALTPDGLPCSPPETTAARWRCWPSWGCAGVPARPSRGAACGGSGPWLESPRDGRREHRPSRPRRPQAPPPPRRGGGRSGRRASWQGACPPGHLPLPRRARGQLHGVRRHRALVLLRLRRGRRRAGLPPAHRGPEPARGDPAAQRRPTDRCGQRSPPPTSSRAGSLAGPGAADGGGPLLRRGAAPQPGGEGLPRLPGHPPGDGCSAWASATRRDAGCGASLRAPASARSGSGTRGCSRSGASASPAWWSFPRSRAVACAGLRDGPSTPACRHGSSRCPGPSPCSGGDGLAPRPRGGKGW